MASDLRRGVHFTLLTFLLSFPALAADDNGGRWLGIDFPRDSPVLALSVSMGPTTAHVRGSSLAVDLHASLILRNVGTKPLSGLTMRVEAQALPSGRGSVSVPSLTAQPGETFPVRIDMELLRPFNAPRNETGPLVQVSLDCALFSDLTAYGPDNLHTRRSLVVYELEARRERQYLASLLKSGQWVQLREELNFGLPESTPPRLGLEFLRDPQMAGAREQPVVVNPLTFRGAPVQPIGGSAQVVGNEIRSPHVEVRNVSQKPVRSVELGWIVRDDRGRDFMAGSVPAFMPEGAIQTVKMTESGALRFSSSSGQPMVIGALRAFINNVEFTDGKLWIPSLSDIDGATTDPILRHEIASSPEQQRLAKLYRQKGTAGLAEELKRLN
jgi:hypothetical protein